MLGKLLFKNNFFTVTCYYNKNILTLLVTKKLKRNLFQLKLLFISNKIAYMLHSLRPSCQV